MRTLKLMNGDLDLRGISLLDLLSVLFGLLNLLSTWRFVLTLSIAIGIDVVLFRWVDNPTLRGLGLWAATIGGAVTGYAWQSAHEKRLSKSRGQL